MPAPTTLADAPLAPELLQEIVSLLAKAPVVEGFEIDPAYFSPSTSTDASRSATLRQVLPQSFSWSPPEASPGPRARRVPLQLCEFLAYKSALAYETAERIESYLTNCCTGHSRLRFFDSSQKGAESYGILADAQGFGFVFERKAFLIFRGTTSGNDWRINSTDALTDDVLVRKDKRYMPLRMTYGPLLDLLGDPAPGRHIGFSIAWAAIKEDVEDWLAEILEAGEADRIVYSGHSLGGAMAQIAAFDHARIADAIGKDRDIKIDHIAAVVTFGAPAVGSKEFTRVYRELIGDQTVLLESSGDLVPRVMNRWYYRLLYPLRQRVKAGVQLHLAESEKFDKVATPWSFVNEPPLSDADIDAALNALAETARRAAKELAEKQEKAKKEAEAKSAGEAQPVDATKPASPSEGQAAKTPTAEAKSEAAPTWIYWAFIGLAALAVAGVAWYFVRRKLYSHDIEQRYALYLSTLSYQELRAKHKGDLRFANADLDEHLRFVRGDVKKGAEIAKQILDLEHRPRPFFDSVLGLPVPIEIRQDPLFLEYLRKQETFV